MFSLHYLNRLLEHGWLFGLMLTACVPAPVNHYTSNPVRVKSAPYIRSPRSSYNHWQTLPGWQFVDLRPSWAALLNSCDVLKRHHNWKSVCARAKEQAPSDNEAIRVFFETAFFPKQLVNQDGTSNGLVTGYYEAKLRGSYIRTERFRYPLYAIPDDLSVIKRSRAEISAGRARLAGRELFWVDDEIELFFMQIQGAGRIELPDGQLVRVGYAGDNGHSYRSIGKKLIDMGELLPDQASLWDIQEWGLQNPSRLSKVLDSNPRYIFFRELPPTATAPIGALGVPLTEGYSIAVDPQSIPLGAPVFLSTTYPNSNSPLNRLVFAQDTGCAVKGKVRADFFWGFGNQAKMQASHMKQSGKMWVLIPKLINQRVARGARLQTEVLN